MSGFLSWDFSVAFFLVFLGCALLSFLANGFLFFVTMRYKELLWQPPFILLKNMSACGFGMTFVTTSVVLSSVAHQQAQIYGCWCIVQFCVLRCFYLTSQITLALMAVERYVFICHGIHYLRMINTANVRISLGLTWVVSVAASIHGGLVLSQIERGIPQQTNGLLCNAVTIKEHIAFSQEEDMLVFGPPSVITTFCILAICYCYGCMYHAALRVSAVLKCNNRRTNFTVGLYLLMILLQLALNIFFVILTMLGESKASSFKMITPILTPILIILPSFINATFLLIRNPQTKQLLFSAVCRKWRSTVKTEVEVLQQGTGGHTCQVERENLETTPPPLPGSVFPSTSEEC